MAAYPPSSGPWMEIDDWDDSVDPPEPEKATSESGAPVESKSILGRMFSRTAVPSTTKQPTEKPPPEKWKLASIAAICVCLFLIILAAVLVVVILFVLVLVPPENQVLDFMNMSANPCHDFYNYACGGWQQSEAEKEGSRIVSRNSLEDAIHKNIADMLKRGVQDGEPMYKSQAKKFFTACINIERLKERGHVPFMEFLKLFGKFPILDPTWKIEDTNMQKLITELTRHGFAPFFRILPITPVSSPKFKISTASPPGYIDTSEAEHNLKLLGVSDDAKGFREEFDTMVAIYNKANSMVLHSDFEKGNFKIKEIQNTMTMGFAFNWLQFIRDIGESPSFTYDTEVTVENIHRIVDFQREIFLQFQIRDIINFMMLPLLAFTNKLDPRFTLKGRSQSQEEAGRTSTCLQQTMDVFGLALKKMYVDEYYNTNYDTFVKDLVKDLKDSYIANIDSSNWLTPREAKTTRDHLETMRVEVGYLEHFEDENFMNEMYGKVSADEYFEYYTGIFRYFMSSRLTSDDKTVYKLSDTLVLQMDTLNPKLNYLKKPNYLAISAAFLQKPKINLEWPGSMNYGALGSEIGMWLLFIWMDKYSTLGDTGNKSSGVNQKLGSCELSSFKGDTAVTLKNNIKASWANDGIISSAGLKASYQAFKSFQKRTGTESKLLWGLKKDSADQIFFLGYAQSWCEVIPRNLRKVAVLKAFPPAHLRVRAALSKFKAFSDAYGCKAGDAMYPKISCDFFRNEVTSV